MLFRSVLAGRGLLSVANKVLIKRPPTVFLQRNKPLLLCLDDCRRILIEVAKAPTPCIELVMGPPDYVGTKDATIHGVGGVVIGDKKECVPTVFRLEWLQDIKDEILKTNSQKTESSQIRTWSMLACFCYFWLWKLCAISSLAIT
jgi:hypothetical protein